MEIIRDTNIDFMRLKKLSFSLSGFLILCGFISLFLVFTGRANLGVDFAGGTSVQVKFEKPVEVDTLRKALSGAGFKDVNIQDFAGSNVVLIKVGQKSGKGEMVAGKISETIKKALGDVKFEVQSATEIGPAVGEKLRRDALIAVLISTIGIILYIAWRFEFKFGVAAAIATFHDVLTVLAVFTLLGKEINLLIVTALLTLAGYSLTDTVVVFDRIRENLRARKGKTFSEVTNRSINEVLSRTIITSLTTFIAVASLLVLGGEVIRDFALALAIGIIVGTYSSVFVASPLVVVWRGEKLVHVKK
ncbi:MAG: protein translocase subunit SecF [Deltaproteobacteria bacterium]|nr:MAG: protein translocase subunit SecF [Deltaproteobacteria bacterium]